MQQWPATRFRHNGAALASPMPVWLLAGCTRPLDPATLIAKARVYREDGAYAAAIIELQNALQQSPDLAEARFLLGTAYFE
jgi:hypothetical protein